MATSIESSGGAGAKRPVGVSEEGLEGLEKIMALIMKRAFGEERMMEPSATSTLALSRQDTREEVLWDLVNTITPKGINPEFWLAWLGTETDFDPGKTLSPGGKGKSSAGAIKRKTIPASRAAAKVAEAERALEAAKQELERTEALEAAILQWAIADHMVKLMSPVFAMGPAWTLMRVVSAHVSAEEIAMETEFVSEPRRKVEAEKEIREERAEVSRKLQAALDLWAGDARFERDIREALVDIVKRYESRSGERAGKREYDRGRDRMRKSVRPSAATDRREVLAGFDVGQEG